MYRKTYEITGYIDPYGDAMCVPCGEKRYTTGQLDGTDTLDGFVSLAPIFLGDEWDSAPTCDYCRETLDVTVIGQ